MFATSWAEAMPVALISLSIKYTGIPASFAFWTAAIDASAAELERRKLPFECHDKDVTGACPALWRWDTHPKN